MTQLNFLGNMLNKRYNQNVANIKIVLSNKILQKHVHPVREYACIFSFFEANL